MSKDPPRFPKVVALLQKKQFDAAAQWIVVNLEPWQYLSIGVDLQVQFGRDMGLFLLGVLVPKVREFSDGKQPLEFITEIGDIVKQAESHKNN